MSEDRETTSDVGPEAIKMADKMASEAARETPAHPQSAERLRDCPTCGYLRYRGQPHISCVAEEQPLSLAALPDPPKGEKP